jgi:hypothetical protein
VIAQEDPQPGFPSFPGAVKCPARTLAPDSGERANLRMSAD